VTTAPPELCHACGLPVERSQSYCLGCGERVGSRSPLLLELLAGIPGQASAAVAPVVEPAPAAPPALRQVARPGLRLPRARVSVLLVLGFLGFGVLLGGAAGSSVNDSLAASAHGGVKLVLPQAASTGATASSPSGAASSSSGEPPAAEVTPTPTEAATTKAPAAKAKAPASSTGSEAGEAASGSSGSGSSSSSSGSGTKLPAVKHVFAIMLSDQPYAAVFGPSSTAPYVSQTLEHRGLLLVHYDAVAHQQLANGIALISGQGPTAETAANCPTYADLTPATVGSEQQVAGNGCVYPSATQTLAGQLTAKHLTWRAYVEGMGESAGQAAACGHPALGQPDPTAVAASGSASYATFRNPFVYFHSLTDSPACKTEDVGLDKLSADLVGSAPSFSYIVPDRCHDGSPTPCAPGAPAGAPAADDFLRKVVPEILASKGYKDGGLLVITTDEAPSSGEFADSSSCCGQPHYPNLPTATTGLTGRGGGAVGALLLSPFIKGGATSQEPYNHFSLLRTIEDLFGLKHLGYAGATGVTALEPALFTASGH
jgi:hypothetical protein